MAYIYYDPYSIDKLKKVRVNNHKKIIFEKFM